MQASFGRPPCRALVKASMMVGSTLAVPGTAEPCGRIVPGGAP